MIGMIENKRFGMIKTQFNGLYVPIDEWIDLYSMSENSKKNVELCINKMNELAEENQQLHRVIEENEKLKQQLKIYKNDGLETLNDLERAYENNKKALSNIEQLDKENRELKKENEQLKQQLEVYQELYPSGKWICDLNSDELKKELSDDWG